MNFTPVFLHIDWLTLADDGDHCSLIPRYGGGVLRRGEGVFIYGGEVSEEGDDANQCFFVECSQWDDNGDYRTHDFGA